MSHFTATIHRPSEAEIQLLRQFLNAHRQLLVITGAGISTASGIPDYRGPQGSYKLGHKPMVHSDFVNSETKRKRYWSRSLVGFEAVHSALPNNGHKALAELEKKKIIANIVTQNVDRLHQKAGAVNVVDLHGRGDHVHCISCGHSMHRLDVHKLIREMNPHHYPTTSPSPSSSASVWTPRVLPGSVSGSSSSPRPASIHEIGLARPDGDADVELDTYDRYSIPQCPCCNGILKPSVVFFGDNVPKTKVEQVYEMADRCDGLLVVGTSLEVFSAYRFVDRISKRGGVPIAILNLGETRAERKQLSGIQFKSEAVCGDLLEQAVAGM